MVSFADARRMMVDGQLRINDMTNPVLIGAVLEVPRERFVPPALAGLAYLDRDLPVGDAGDKPRFLLKPLVLAKLIEIAGIRPADRVLDVGCATGYSSAVLSHLAAEIVALEEDAGLAAHAREALGALGCVNVTVRIGPLAQGFAEGAPFDVIVVNGAVERVPQALTAQLAEGGRLVCVEPRGPAGKGVIYRVASGHISARPVFDAAAPLLPGFAEPPIFVF